MAIEKSIETFVEQSCEGKVGNFLQGIRRYPLCSLCFMPDDVMFVPCTVALAVAALGHYIGRSISTVATH